MGTDKDIYPIFVDDGEINQLYLILQKYSNIILEMAKTVGEEASENYNKSVKIINKLIEKTENAISPMPCISDACLNSNYCHLPEQCDFVKFLKIGYKVARVSDNMVPVYRALGWERKSIDNLLSSSQKRNLMIFRPK